MSEIICIILGSLITWFTYNKYSESKSNKAVRDAKKKLDTLPVSVVSAIASAIVGYRKSRK